MKPWIPKTTRSVSHDYLMAQLVNIEEVHSDGYATVRRVEGEWTGVIAVCLLESL